MIERIKKLQNSLPDGVDAALVTEGINRRYYTKFRSSAGTLLITKNSATFIVDFRYIEAAEKTIKGCDIFIQNTTADLKNALNNVIKKEGIKTVGTDVSYMSVTTHKQLADMIDAELLCDNRVDEVILEQRRYKSQEEIDNIVKAQRIAEAGFEHILKFVKVGMTEREVSLELEYTTKKLGSEENSFDFIVVSGVRTSMPHARPIDKKIEAGDFVTMDFGCKIDGYHSDMTRTFAVGHVSDEQKKAYDTVLKAQLASLDAIKAGVRCCDIDKVARDIIYGAGYEGCFGHGLGHGVGLEIHENPRYNGITEKLTQAGHVMTVEPGVYLKNQFGLRIEDMVVVTETGHINLTKSPKELIIL